MHGRQQALQQADDFAISDDKYLRTLTTVLAMMRDFEGVLGAKRNKGATESNNDSPHRVGVVMANASNKPMAKRDCFGCGKKGHTIAQCTRISAETKKELMSLGNFGMRSRLETVKRGKTMSKEGSSYGRSHCPRE